MEFDNATNFDRKSGGSPTIALPSDEELSAVASFGEGNGNKPSSSQVRWGEPGAPRPVLPLQPTLPVLGDKAQPVPSLRHILALLRRKAGTLTCK